MARGHNKSHSIPLALAATARGFAKAIGTSAKDAQVINGLFDISVNPLMGTKSAYVVKRPGSTTSGTIGTNPTVCSHTSGFFLTISFASGTIYSGTSSPVSLGTATPPSFSNNQLSDSVANQIGVLAWVSGGAGYYLWSDADDSASFIGDRTSGSAVISGISSTTGIYPGQLITGTGIPASTRVQSVDSATQITMTANATSGSGTSTTITKEAVAKVLDSQFPAQARTCVFLNGRLFVGEVGGRIYQSALNDPSSWAANDYITADYAGDSLNYIFKHGQYIVAAGSSGTNEFFYDAGNATGSVLSKAPNLLITGLWMGDYSPLLLGNSLYFIGNPRSGTNAVYNLYRLSGPTSYEQISDNYWGGIIRGIGAIAMGTATVGERTLLMLRAESVSTQIVYDPFVQMFSIFVMDSPIRTTHSTWFTKDGSTSLFAWSNGDVWTDSDVAYTMTIQTEPQVMAGGYATTDTWADLIADTQASGETTFSTSDDDYATWNTQQSFDMTQQRKRSHALGWHQAARAYRLQHSANTGWRGQLLIINHAPSSM